MSRLQGKVRGDCLQEALKDLEAMKSEKQWAKLSVSPHMIAIYYGVIHSNGMEECAIGSISYFPQADGSIMKVAGRKCG